MAPLEGEAIIHSPRRGSIIRLILITLPLFAVLVYLLHEVHIRPTLDRYNLPEDADDAIIAEANAEPVIELSEIFYVFLSISLIWSILLIHLVAFAPRLRLLMKRYTRADTISVLGDVRYRKDDCTSRLRYLFFKSDYAIVEYTVPVNPDVHEGESREPFMQSKIASFLSYCGVSSQPKSPVKAITVWREIRTYHPYDREQITIIVLPNLPKSGIPKVDIEADIATHMGRDRMNALLWIAGFWVVFSILGDCYVLIVMKQIDPDDSLWVMFAITLAFGLPLVAGLCNLLRYLIYKRCITNSGRVANILDVDDEKPRISSSTRYDRDYHVM